jgi:hypothetical protein
MTRLPAELRSEHPIPRGESPRGSGEEMSAEWFMGPLGKVYMGKKLFSLLVKIFIQLLRKVTCHL